MSQQYEPSLSENSHDERAPKPNAMKGLLFLIVIGLAAAGLGMFVLAQRSVDGPLVVTSEPIPISVDVTLVQLQDAFDIEEKFSGLVTPRRTSQLGFSSSGRVQQLSVDTGDRVKTGQRLGSLDTRALQAQLKSLKAVVAEAEASHRLALTTVDRQKKLLAKGHVTQQRVDEAQAQADTALARINAAEANADTTRVAISLARIEAPFAGTVTERYLDEGAIAAPGQVVFELVETSALEARIGVPLTVADRLNAGETYTLIGNNQETQAVLRTKTDVIDTGRRTVEIVFDLVNSDALAAGTVVRVALDQTVTERGIWVPVSALYERERGLWSVFVAKPEGNGWTAEPGTVEIIHSEGDRAYVRGSMVNGDLVIMDGLQRITPGQSVNPNRGEQTADRLGNG